MQMAQGVGDWTWSQRRMIFYGWWGVFSFSYRWEAQARAGVNEMLRTGENVLKLQKKTRSEMLLCAE